MLKIKRMLLLHQMKSKFSKESGPRLDPCEKQIVNIIYLL